MTELGLRERKKIRTKRIIGRVTLELVMKKDFDSVRIEDICETAEISRATFFRYFDSKEAAYVSGLHEGRKESIIEAVRRRPAKEGPLEAAQNGFIDSSADWREYRDLILLDASIRAASPAVAARANSEFLAWEIGIASAVEARIAAGPSKEVTARVISAAVMSAVRIVTERWVASGARGTPIPLYRRVFATVNDLVCR